MSPGAGALLAVLAWPSAMAPDEPVPDTVVLTTGATVSGRVVFEDLERLIVRVKSRERIIDQDDVSSVRAALRELPLALDLMAEVNANDVGRMLELARQLDSMNLPLEARLLRWRALSRDPSNDEAHELLGHRKRGKAWVAPVGSRWYPLERLADLRAEWNDAWEFSTTHYDLRASLPLSEVIDLAIELERTYRVFYETFGPDLELHDIVDRMNVRVYGDASSFPESVGSSRAYFDPNDETVYMDASGGLVRRALVHEATHGLLYWTARRTRSERGVIPGWLDEGFAQYMAAATSGTGTTSGFEVGLPDQRLLWTHASAKKPYGLTRVLNFQSGDFGGTSSQSLKYAQSYTLVYFCLHADGGAHREGFLDYLRLAYEGRASSTDFERALGGDNDALEEAWGRFVREAAR